MKKLFTLIALCLGISSGAWAAGYVRTLNDGITVSGYTFSALYNFQTNTPEVLPTSGDLRYRDGNIWGLHNFGSGTRSATVTISVKENDLIILQDYNGTATITGCSANATASAATGYLCFNVAADANSITISTPRYGGVVAAVVMNKDNTAENADYNIICKYGDVELSSTTINGVVGETPTFTTNPIWKSDVKYIYESDDLGSKTIASDNSTTVTLQYRLANSYTYSIASSVPGVNYNGTAYEGENVTVSVPRYINVAGTLYETPTNGGDWYHHTYAMNDNVNATITYNATSITNVVLYAEAEELPGATSGNGNGTRTSKGLTGFGANLPVTTLTPGKYVIRIHGANGNSASRAVAFKNGDDAIAEFTIAGSNNNQEYSSAEFTIMADADITLTAEGSQASGVDWFYIQKTGEAPDAIVSITPAIGYATFYDSEHAVNIPNGVTPYIFGYDLSNSSVLTLVKYEDALQRYKHLTYNGVIPAGEAVVLKGDADVELTYNATCDLPLLKDYNYLCGKDVEGTTTPPSGWQMIPCTYYALSLNSSNDPNSVGFYFMEAGGAAFTTAAHKAYLWLPFNVYEPTLAPSRFLFNEGEATAIKTVNTTANRGMMFNLAGQRVNANAKGIVVVNGKKVLNK